MEFVGAIICLVAALILFAISLAGLFREEECCKPVPMKRCTFCRSTDAPVEVYGYDMCIHCATSFDEIAVEFLKHEEERGKLTLFDKCMCSMPWYGGGCQK